MDDNTSLEVSVCIASSKLFSLTFLYFPVPIVCHQKNGYRERQDTYQEYYFVNHF